MTEPYPSSPPSTRIYIWATVVLVVLLGMSLTFYFIGTRTPGTNNTNANASVNVNGTTQPGESAAPPVAPEPEVIQTRTGTITRVSNSSIRFTAQVYSDEKGMYEPKDITAEFSDDTKFLEEDRTSLPIPPVPGQPAQEPVQKTILKSDLAVKDVVDVYAAENIRGATKFTATEIHRIRTTK
jgi:hypothetical protein